VVSPLVVASCRPLNMPQTSTNVLVPAPQIQSVSRRHCVLYKLNLPTYYLLVPSCMRSSGWWCTLTHSAQWAELSTVTFVTF